MRPDDGPSLMKHAPDHRGADLLSVAKMNEVDLNQGDMCQCILKLDVQYETNL